jgi:hypothetical protein
MRRPLVGGRMVVTLLSFLRQRCAHDVGGQATQVQTGMT